MKKTHTLIVVLACACALQNVSGVVIDVRPGLGALEKAQQEVRALIRKDPVGARLAGIEVVLADGIYRIAKPIVFGELDSGCQRFICDADPVMCLIPVPQSAEDAQRFLNYIPTQNEIPDSIINIPLFQQAILPTDSIITTVKTWAKGRSLIKNDFPNGALIDSSFIKQ